MKKILLPLFLALILLSGCSSQQTVIIKWTAPTTGTPVDHYVLVLYGDDAPSTFETKKTSLTVKINEDETYIAIVAGVSASGEQGEFSEPSEPFKLEK